MIPRVCAFFAFSSACILAACDGTSPVPKSPLQEAVLATPDPLKTIGGVVDTTVFTVRAGATLVVDKELVVFASDSVQINGELVVANGDKLAFFTPTFTIARRGKIRAGYDYNAPKESVIISACAVSVSAGGILDIPGGDDLEMVADRKSTSTESCSIFFDKDAFVTLATGYSGGTLPSGRDQPNGQNGGWIEIGSSKAIADADALARHHGHPTMKSFAPATLVVNSSLQAGNGGPGENDPSGTMAANGYAFAGVNGGNGGNVDISVAKIVGTQPFIAAGNGGTGGTIGISTTYNNNPMNGTASSPNAAPVTIQMGSGGKGGSLDVRGTRPANLVLTEGNGGNPSLVTSKPTYAAFWAGDGFSPSGATALTAGNGANLTLTLAMPGDHGIGGNSAERTPTDGKYYPVTFGGGDGGQASGSGSLTYIYGVAAGQLIQGGTGGNLTIVAPARSKPSELVNTYGLKISIGNFGSGGASVLTAGPALACPSPAPKGVNGGNAGTLHDNGLWPAMYPALANFGFGFYGGGGSPGNPGGYTGSNGNDDEGQQIGQAAIQQDVICG